MPKACFSRRSARLLFMARNYTPLGAAVAPMEVALAINIWLPQGPGDPRDLV